MGKGHPSMFTNNTPAAVKYAEMMCCPGRYNLPVWFELGFVVCGPWVILVSYSVGILLVS